MRLRIAIPGAMLAGLLLASPSIVTLAGAAPRATITVSPAAVSIPGDGPGGCVIADPGVTWTCTFHVSEPASSVNPVNWSASAVEIDSQDPVTFKPAAGTLHPGQSVAVHATIGCELGGAFLIATSANGTDGAGAAVDMMECG